MPPKVFVGAAFKPIPKNSTSSPLYDKSKYIMPNKKALYQTPHSSNVSQIITKSPMSLPFGNTSIAAKLGSMPHPQQMDAELLATWCSVAARENVTNESFWFLMRNRAKQLIFSMQPREMSIILNAMSRMRVQDSELLNIMAPHIVSYIQNFSIQQIAMILSSVAKMGLPANNTTLLPALSREIKNRMHEMVQAIELCMVMSSLTKLGMYEKALYSRLAAHITTRLLVEPFHVRDLSVIASAFSDVNHHDLDLFQRLADRAVNTIEEASPTEVARLIGSFSKANFNAANLIEKALKISVTRLGLMNAKELTTAAYVFGQLRENVSEEQLPLLTDVFEHIAHALTGQLPVSAPDDIIALAKTFSRWQIPMDYDDLLPLLENAQSYILPSLLSSTSKRNYMPSSVSNNGGGGDAKINSITVVTTFHTLVEASLRLKMQPSGIFKSLTLTDNDFFKNKKHNNSLETQQNSTVSDTVLLKRRSTIVNSWCHLLSASSTNIIEVLNQRNNNNANDVGIGELLRLMEALVMTKTKGFEGVDWNEVRLSNPVKTGLDAIENTIRKILIKRAGEINTFNAGKLLEFGKALGWGDEDDFMLLLIELSCDTSK